MNSILKGFSNFRWAVIAVSGKKVEYNTLINEDPWKPLPDLNGEHNDSASVGMDGDELVVAGGTDRETNIFK